jgi:biotin operon repressor
VVYRRSHDIELRLEEILRLISVGRYATPALAKALRVSIPTVSRCVTALRDRGYDIRAVKQAGGWQYVLHKTKGQGRFKSKRASYEGTGASR